MTVGRRLASSWLLLLLLSGASCGGGLRTVPDADDEPPLKLADAADCGCTVAGANPVPPMRNHAGGEHPGAAAQRQRAAPVPDAATIAARYAAEAEPLQAPRWTGRRIDFEVEGADLTNALRLLAEIGEIDMVIADDVAGTVSMRMKDVPWDQALDAVIRSESLAVTRNGRVLVIRRGP